MRGKVAGLDRVLARFRITPAYAGKRRLGTLSCTGVWDHPRLCGEKSEKVEATVIAAGSPPPMRGKV